MTFEKFLIICFVATTTVQFCEGICGNNTSGGTEVQCYMGDCVEGECVCFDGWQGATCHQCLGRVLLNDSSGIIEDGPQNYSSPSKCSWLIKPTFPHSTLRLRFNEFSSECGWDYLYVYDGDSAFSPILATYNGLVYTKDFKTRQPPEIVAKSGSAFLHFYSDVAKQMMGFNIFYSIDECPYDCFSNGNCNSADSTCDCSSEWSGRVCDNPVCPANCSDTSGQCVDGGQGDTCLCIDGQHGNDCSVSTSTGAWEVKEFPTDVKPRASFSGATSRDTMWIFGGIQFSAVPQINENILTYNQTSNQWTTLTPSNFPSPRYGHSMVYLSNDKLLVFGGKLLSTERTTDELWEYNINSNSWNTILYTSDFGNYTNKKSIYEFGILSLSGHSANLVTFENGTEVMVVIFGYHPTMEYSGFVYEYNPSTQFWVRPRLGGYTVSGLFEHSTVYDAVNQMLYVHGGMRRSTLTTDRSVLSDGTYSYDPETRVFRKLTSSGVPRYLHASVLVSGVMYVYGGNLYNDTDEVNTPLCYTENFLAYSVVCDRWIHQTTPNNSIQAGRYGHEATLFQASASYAIYFISGYDSTLISDALVYTPGQCDSINNESYCIDSFSNGISCYWNGSDCIANIRSADQDKCEILLETDTQSQCSNLNLCSDCLSNSFNCSYCSGSSDLCQPNTGDPTCLQNTSQCSAFDQYCSNFHNCEQCENAGSECTWAPALGQNSNTMICQRSSGNGTNGSSQCSKACTEIESCSECTQNCMWCVNLKKCFAVNSYVIQFPYGQCMEWSNKNTCPPSDCAGLKTCTDCQDNPKCGWCDDGSLTGLGTCKEGSDLGSLTLNNATMQYDVDTSLCANTSWYFTSCPSCQCNGHSQCDEDDNCIRCQDQTAGTNCENCLVGYYGDARNGGECKKCECNNKATSCSNNNGRCNCFTKGVIGDHCELCDAVASYVGNATGNGTCYYPLLINYQFTFTLTQGQDDDITEINFQNIPLLEDDVQLTFQAQSPCRIRMAIISSNTIQLQGGESDINILEDVTSLQYTFGGSDFQFGKAGVNSTIRIYVSNFTIPLWIKVSLLQRSNKLLTILLILFSSFLVILLIAAAVWKLKMMYDAHHQRRNRAEQMQQMAARPFAGIHLCCDDIYRSTEMLVSPQKYGYQALDTVHREPDIVCEEKCANSNASVISVFLWLPSGCGSADAVDATAETPNSKLKCQVAPPPGQSALVIGTALTDGDKHSVTPIPSPKLIARSKSISKKRASPPLARDSRSDELTANVTVGAESQGGSQAPPPAYVNHGMMHTYI